MARISGVELPNHKRIDISLRYLYGVGATNAVKILEQARVDLSKRAKDLSEEEILRIQRVIDTIAVEGDLRREVIQNIRHKQSIGTYQGLRHKSGLPVHGQRTRHNARTRRGRRKTVGTVRKEVVAKTGGSK
ncbi:MAG: 30S ribosomal protein S13 [bacterium]|nr:30S ribosomal protein S13 [bacterium]